MKIVFTWDDGAVEDLKLIALHEKYNLPGMFFVPNFNKEGRAVISADDIKHCASSLISFGGHTKNHSYLTTVAKSDLDEEIYANQAYLSELLGTEIPHFCLPGGKYNEEVLASVYKYYKTIRTADTMNFRNEGTLIKPSFHIYPRGYKSLVGNAMRNGSNSVLLNLLMHPNRDYFETLADIVDLEKNKSSADIIFWGHSWELEEFGLWNSLEEIMKNISLNYKENCVSYDELFK